MLPSKEALLRCDVFASHRGTPALARLLARSAGWLARHVAHSPSFPRLRSGYVAGVFFPLTGLWRTRMRKLNASSSLLFFFSFLPLPLLSCALFVYILMLFLCHKLPSLYAEHGRQHYFGLIC